MPSKKGHERKPVATGWARLFAPIFRLSKFRRTVQDMDVLMSTLSNNFTAVEMWNLNPGGGERGPFLVVQAGIAPGDEQVRESLWVLRPDGKWVDSMYYGAKGTPELLDEALFASSQDVMDLLGRLAPKAEVEPTQVTEEELRSWLARTEGRDAMASVRRFLEGYKERHTVA